MKTREAKVGETVQSGWFVFRIVDGQNGTDLEALDFMALASFTSDFQIPEQIHWAQHETLTRLGVDESACRLSDPALVSRSYRARGRNAFIARCAPASGTDSGWYAGVAGETRDFNDVDSLHHQSRYELAIHDERFSRFWLLTVGYRIYFDSDEPRIEEAPGIAMG